MRRRFKAYDLGTEGDSPVIAVCGLMIQGDVNSQGLFLSVQMEAAVQTHTGVFIFAVVVVIDFSSFRLR